MKRLMILEWYLSRWHTKVFYHLKRENDEDINKQSGKEDEQKVKNSI